MAPLARAQEIDSSKAERFQLGPLGFTPSILLSNLGVDDNVFNSPDDPQRDTTAAIGPAVTLGMRMGPSILTGKASAQYLYFEKFESQRGLNTDTDLRVIMPFARIRPFVRGQYVTSKNRTGYEIESRVGLNNQSMQVGAEVRVTAKTSVTASVTRRALKFDTGDVYDGVNLADALNRMTTDQSLELRHKLSALTTIALLTDVVRDRFTDNPLRDSNSVSVVPGFDLQPSALIAGRVFVGVRRLSPLDPTVPSYTGFVASVDAKYTLQQATQIDLKVARDVAYSYSADQPYYLLTDAGIGAVRRLTYTWDVSGRFSRQGLDYHTRVPGLAPVSNALTDSSRPLNSAAPRLDTIRQFSAGVGYRVGGTFRVGFDTTYYQRQSTQFDGNFNGLRFGASLSYGAKQQ